MGDLRNFIFLLILFSFSGNLFAQNSDEDRYISKKLSVIDSLIAIEEFEKANLIIENTKNTFSFDQNLSAKLELDYRSNQIFYEKGEKTKSLENFLIGFEALRESNEIKLYIKYANFIAKIFAKSQNFEKGIYYSKLALTKADEIKDTANIAKSLIRLGSFYYNNDDIEKAKSYYKKVLVFPIALKTEKYILNAYTNLSILAQTEYDFDLSEKWLNKALDIKINQRDSLGMAMLEVNIGNLHHHQKKYRLAIENYNHALNTIIDTTKSEVVNVKKVIYDNLSVSYDSLKEYKSAYQNLVKSRKLGKELVSGYLAENLAEVETKYKLAIEEQKVEEEKNKTFKTQVLFLGLVLLTIGFVIISFVFYKNNKLKQQSKLEQINSNLQVRIINATIDAKEKERKSISEILHDSVSALLSSANLHLQAAKSQLTSEVPIEITKAQQIVGEASVKIRNLSHELISSVLLKFGLAFAVHDICEKYSNSKLEFLSDADGIKRYNQKFEIKIYSIIEELMNNILKHSDASHATITLVERNTDTLLIQITDDGVGFDVEKAKAKDGLGLNHIDARIKIMKGVFKINSSKRDGTSVFISVPILKK